VTLRTYSLWLIASLVWLSSTASLLSLQAYAELYAGPQIGATLPLKFSQVEGQGSASGTDDIQQANSFLYGGKVGYFLPSSLTWLGMEADVYHLNPHLKQHTFTLDSPGGPTMVTEGVRLGMTTMALRVVIRNPGHIPGEPDHRFASSADWWQRLEPYLAMGPAFFFTHTSTQGGTSANTNLGFSFAFGSRYFLQPSLALFAEYKLDGTHLTLSNALGPGAGLRGDYTAHNLSVGMTYHFQGF
jgi:hypothetical protein